MSTLSIPSPPKHARKPRLSKKLKRAIDLWLSGKARTRKEAAAKAGLSEDYFGRALKRTAARSFISDRAHQNISDATLRASSRVLELLDGESEHVAAKVGLRLLESEKLIAPVGGAGAVNINHFGSGPVGYCVDFSGRGGREGIPSDHPLKPEKELEYAAWQRGEIPGCAIGPDDLMPIDVTPAPDRLSDACPAEAIENSEQGDE